MRILSEEKVRVLVERNGWSPAYAQGYIDGESVRRRGALPSKYAQVGLDDYCQGFRAGFYERNSLSPTRSSKPDALLSIRRKFRRR
jgi:hypothetical protein